MSFGNPLFNRESRRFALRETAKFRYPTLRSSVTCNEYELRSKTLTFQHDGPRTVVILDEVDQLEDPSVIYDLHSLPQFAIICIANTGTVQPHRRPSRQPPPV